MGQARSSRSPARDSGPNHHRQRQRSVPFSRQRRRSLSFADVAVEERDDDATEDESGDMPAHTEDSEDDGVVLRRSSRQNKPTAKVAERNATNLRNQRIQSAYIAAAERLGGVQRTTCEQIVRSLQVQFPALRTKDVQALHRLLKKQSEMRTMEEGKLPGETDAEFTERWNAPENVDARAFNKELPQPSGSQGRSQGTHGKDSQAQALRGLRRGQRGRSPRGGSTIPLPSVKLPLP